MSPFYKASITDNEDLSILSCFKKPLVYKALKQIEKKYEKIEYPDVRPMYEDVVSVKDILCKMFYISDRWECVGRIKFILRVLEEVK